MPYFMTHDGIRIQYRDQGRGKTLVFLHGWRMSSAVWRLQFEGLASRFRLVAPDLRGHGVSDISPGGTGFAEFADDLSELLNTLDLSDVALIGWSLGAQVALEAFPQVRERVSSLVLVSGTPRFTACNDFPYGLSRIQSQGMVLKLRRNYQKAMAGFLDQLFAEGELDSCGQADMVRDVLAEIPLPVRSAAFESLQSLMEGDMRQRLKDIDRPVLVMNGDSDTICLPSASAYLATMLANAEQRIMKGCGHAPFLTRSNQFNSIISEFCQEL